MCSGSHLRWIVLALAVGSCADADAVAEDEAAARYAQVECAALFECGCSDPGFADVDACVAERTQKHASDLRSAHSGPLTYDGECVGRQVLEQQGAGCSLGDEAGAPGRGCSGSCSAYHGDREAGPGCRVFGGFSDCAQGLVCFNAACTTPCEAFAAQAGATCRDEDGQMTVASCDVGLACKLSSGTCSPAGSVGQSCAAEPECAPGAYCSGMQCTSAQPAGAACTAPRECASGVCGSDGTCKDEPLVCGLRTM